MNKKYLNFPNFLTASRIIFGIIFLLLYLFSHIKKFDESRILIIEIISLFIFIIAIITDGLDGYFARKQGQITSFGQHFDPLSDSIFFVIVFFTFFLIGIMKWYFFVIILLREGFMHFFLRPYYKSKGKYLPASLYGKLKTFFQALFSIIILSALIFKHILIVFNLFGNILIYYNIILNITAFLFFLIIVLLSVFSLIIYLIHFIKTFNK